MRMIIALILISFGFLAAAGMSDDYMLAKALVWARCLRIADGPDEVCLLVVCQRFVRACICVRECVRAYVLCACACVRSCVRVCMRVRACVWDHVVILGS